MASPDDVRFMTEAIELAARGVGDVEPNPPVGALVVRDGEVVGKGFHRYYGGAHAEIEALDAAGVAAAGAILYVTLEPCSTTGKTPPCVERVVASRVAKVVCGAIDPNPAHAGAGIHQLRDRGIDVELGVCEKEATALIDRFRRGLGRETPFVIAKWAMSLDGKIATARGDSKWISSEESRRMVHTLRGRVDGIGVGIGTVIADDPTLTARPPGPRPAKRIVFDDALRLPDTWRALHDDGPSVVVLHASGAVKERVAELQSEHVELVGCDGPDRASRTATALRELKRRGVNRLLVEGGGGLIGGLLDLREIDQVVVFIAPKLVGGASAPGPVGGIGVQRIAQALMIDDGVFDRIGTDYCFRGFLGQ